MMRPAYLGLKFVLKYALWVYYPRLRVVNKPKRRFARTIYASNHAASFMDPLVVASNQPPIVFFMTRSDVFTPLLKPLLWAAHMLPIYRSHDGEDTKSKNEEVFQKCYRILKYGRSLIVFAEGFTDDVFVRRLKPIKKGAVRIGFGALEEINWSKMIYVQAVGVNYSDPNHIGSDVVVSNGDPICLNDFKESYLENPAKVINDLTKRVEQEMKDQLTYVEDIHWTSFHEQVMMLTRKGMNAKCVDRNIPLLQRWKYSRNLANWMNEQDLDENPELLELKKDLENYFELLRKKEVEEHEIHEVLTDSNHPMMDLIYFMTLFPLVLVGLIHNYPVYRFVKRFVEKSFRRPVFWGSVKMLLGTLLNGLYNILLVVLANFLVYRNPSFWVVYFFTIPAITGMIAYAYFERLKKKQKLNSMKSHDWSNVVELRQKCREAIQKIIPIA